jgi:hypothetical protein
VVAAAEPAGAPFDSGTFAPWRGGGDPRGGAPLLLPPLASLPFPLLLLLMPLVAPAIRCVEFKKKTIMKQWEKKTEKIKKET